MLKNILEFINSNKNYFTNDLIERFYILLEKYKAFLSTLTAEQIALVVNICICAFVIVIVSLFSIAEVLYGDFLIRYFKLEEKSTLLAKFIKIRRKFK